MPLIYQGLMAIHLLSGSISLIMFWIPAFAKKGGKLHKQVGQVYVWAMSVVLASAMALCLYHFLFTGRYVTGLILSFLSFLTLNPLWTGMDALRQKRGLSPRSWQVRLGLDILLLVYGLFLLVIAWRFGNLLILIFGIGGSLSAIPLIKAVRQKQGKFNWYDNHRSQMIISGSAAYTAFFAFGARRLLEGIQGTNWVIIPWVAPTLIAVWVIRRLRRQDKKPRKAAKIA